MIEVRNINKSYAMGEYTVGALKDVSLSIDKGEFVSVKGSSGSGKSTLMNILGCLDRPDNGKYLLFGEDVGSLSENRLAEIRNREIGFVFQTFNLLTRTTTLENVELPLLYAGVKDAKERAREALKKVNMVDRVNHHPNQLSGGQRQRVAIARAIVTNPSIILADEPTGNLDTGTGSEILNIFETLNKSGVSLIIVTHDDDVAKRCRRCIRLQDGRVIDDVC